MTLYAPNAHRSTLFSLLLLAILLAACSVCVGPARAAQPLVRLPGHVPEAAIATAHRVGDVPAGQPIPLSFVLPLRNQAALSDLLTRLYDPKDPLYGHYLTPQQFADQFLSARPMWMRWQQVCGIGGFDGHGRFRKSHHRGRFRDGGDRGAGVRAASAFLRAGPGPRFLCPGHRPGASFGYRGRAWQRLSVWTIPSLTTRRWSGAARCALFRNRLPWVTDPMARGSIRST